MRFLLQFHNILIYVLLGSAIITAALDHFTVAIITAAQFAITYMPFLQKIFATESVSLFDGMLIIGVGIASFVIIETEKQIRLHIRTLRNNND